MALERFVISKEFTFEASHVLPKHEGKCSRLHGHSWRLRVAIIGPVYEQSGFVADYAKLSELVRRLILDRFDHQHLGFGDAGQFKAATSLYPTSEVLTRHFATLLRPEVPLLAPAEFLGTACAPQLFEVSLDETCTSRCVWRNQDVPKWWF